MTEYDYSPEALQHHHAKQAHVADWVHHTHHHEPANPFLPSSPSRTYSDGYHHHSSPRTYPVSYPASYYTPTPYASGVNTIPSQYLGSSSHGHKHRHRRRNSWSSGLYPTSYYNYAPNVASPYVPMNMGYNYAPMIQRSFTTPSSIATMAPAATMPWYGQQPYAGGYYPPTGMHMQPLVYPSTYYPPGAYTGYPTATAAYGYPQPYLPRAMSHSGSHHHSRRHSRSRSDPGLYISSTYGVGNGYPPYPIVQAPSNQSACVPIGGGGYAIIPPGQKAVISPTGTHPTYAPTSRFYYPGGYDSDSGSSRDS